MVEETMFMRNCLPGKTQRGTNLLADFLSVGPPALLCDAQRGEAKPCGGDTGHVARIVALRGTAVFGESGRGIGLLKEELRGSFGDFFEQRIVVGQQWPRGVRAGSLYRVLARGKWGWARVEERRVQENGAAEARGGLQQEL